MLFLAPTFRWLMRDRKKRRNFARISKVSRALRQQFLAEIHYSGRALESKRKKILRVRMATLTSLSFLADGHRLVTLSRKNVRISTRPLRLLSDFFRKPINSRSLKSELCRRADQKNWTVDSFKLSRLFISVIAIIIYNHLTSIKRYWEDKLYRQCEQTKLYCM